MTTKTAFLILGAQRSGTSVVSHMLSKFGINFGNPERFLQADHNPIFFELKWVNLYNDRLIQSLGYKYTDFFLPIETDYDRENTIEIVEKLPEMIQSEWDGELKIGIKDPRFSLTFPAWEKALLALGYKINIIFALRHPVEFLHSNQKLFHNWAGWDDLRHLNFWLQLNFAAVYFTRNYSVFLANYDDIMRSPLEMGKHLANFFHFDEKEAATAAAVVDQTYHHYKQSGLTGYSFVDHFYSLLCSRNVSEIDYLNYRRHVLAEVD